MGQRFRRCACALIWIKRPADQGKLYRFAAKPAKMSRFSEPITLAPRAPPTTTMLTFQQIILTLQTYWDKQGCALLQPYDMEVGAGTFHTGTFLRAIG